SSRDTWRLARTPGSEQLSPYVPEESGTNRFAVLPGRASRRGPPPNRRPQLSDQRHTVPCNDGCRTEGRDEGDSGPDQPGTTGSGNDDGSDQQCGRPDWQGSTVHSRRYRL